MDINGIDMKTIKKIERLLINCVILSLIQVLSVASICLGNSRVIEDTIVEASSDCTMIQVGNYMIDSVDSYFIDNGTNDDVSATSGDLYLGAMVKVVLQGKDENGFWRAESVTLLSAVKTEQNPSSVAVSVKGNSPTQGDNEVTASSAQKSSLSDNQDIKLIDGVWQN